jgi:hypothetical protein
LDKTDASLFTELCSFGWWIGYVVPLVFEVLDEVYRRHGITFESLSHLDSIGLVQFGTIGGFMQRGLHKRLRTSYYEQLVDLEFQNETGNQLEIGRVVLTRIGQQLAPICGSKPDQAFFNYVVNYWKQRGYIKEEGRQPAGGNSA